MTREDYPYQGRITHLLENQKFFKDLDIPSFDIETDRVMICGSIEMNHDMKTLLEAQGFVEGSRRTKGEFVIERAFVG